MPPPKQSLFGRLAASGWHTCAMAMRMMCDAYLLESASLGSPGLEKLTWPAPVYPGDTLHDALRCSSRGRWPAGPEVGMVTIRYEVMNQHGEIVLSMEGFGILPPARPPAACPPDSRDSARRAPLLTWPCCAAPAPRQSQPALGTRDSAEPAVADARRRDGIAPLRAGAD